VSTHLLSWFSILSSQYSDPGSEFSIFSCQYSVLSFSEESWTSGEGILAEEVYSSVKPLKLDEMSTYDLLRVSLLSFPSSNSGNEFLRTTLSRARIPECGPSIRAKGAMAFLRSWRWDTCWIVNSSVKPLKLNDMSRHKYPTCWSGSQYSERQGAR